MQSLGLQGLAPQILAYVDRKGRPLGGLALSALFGLLCFLAAYKDQGTVFDWLLSVAGLATIFSWFNIALCHFRFRQAMHAQGRSLEELTFTSITGMFPIGSKNADAEHFFQNYLGAVVILVFYVGHKLYARTWKICKSLNEIDLDTGRRQVDLDLVRAELEEKRLLNKQKPLYKRIWNYWF